MFSLGPRCQGNVVMVPGKWQALPEESASGSPWSSGSNSALGSPCTVPAPRTHLDVVGQLTGPGSANENRVHGICHQISWCLGVYSGPQPDLIA